ncbi:hypothetical protein P171DRAFT_437397 [Karstenula rhodostoma CBS 690.94]|uniref:DUF8004 domain-containing protein n=1 Tax=Karstenula rhodostoma CBS 690.94 TaxID=1392251 RepID=A0A9P4P5L1_9PLEO|nr:hypothetical protein P171DRAFT_437397 [Karstenula rhodostoma CBS 690.94]
MLSAPKKNTGRRLSSLFSMGSSDSKEAKETKEPSSAASSESSRRLSKVRKRITSHSLTPDYPAPSQTPPVPARTPTIQTVDSLAAAFEPLQPPPPLTSSNPNSRSSSPGRLSKSRPVTPRTPSAGLLAPATDAELKRSKRRSRLFGYGESSDERVQDARLDGPLAWVVGHKGKVEYSLTMLLNGERVPELWDDNGDTFVYLFPRTSDNGPSFRIDSSVYASSPFMTRLLHGQLYSETAEFPDRSVRNSSATYGNPSRTGSPEASVIDSPEGSKGSRALSDATEDDHSEKHLYMPIALSTDQAPITPTNSEPKLITKDIDTLVSYRNFFAFLIGQSLVATQRHSGIFDIFMRIADILQHYNFSNVDGSTYGEVAASSFNSYVDELYLADVRQSRVKAIEAIVLGERMRSMSLYTEGFVHAVGKFDSIKELNDPKYNLISPKTGTRLARAALDLDNREKNINDKLKEFEFPAMFAGIMNSAMADEKKAVRFGKWKSAFMSTRSFAVDYYKSKYGGWLPKARSKKNNLTTSGLNRLVLLEIYHDLSDLYDLLVDRTNLTNRTADGFMSEDERTDFESIAALAMRKVLSEYDRSTPPVQPPIPFDIPLYPTLREVNKDYPSGDRKKDAKSRGKKLSKDQIARMIKAAHNADSEKNTPFLDAFRHFEQKQASGCTMEELYELRAGQWLFLYAVIQSLPMLVIDAPGVQFTDGVEYFLCEVPRAGSPWGREDTSRARTWFGVAGGSQVVSLPTDVVENGVEGVFRRSHCWEMAAKWAQNDTPLNAAMPEMNAAPLPPPPGFLDASSAIPRPRSESQQSDRRRESVMNLGLEALPLPPGFAPGGAAPSPGSNSPMMRLSSMHDPNKTFDSILESVPNKKDKKDKKKK